VPDRRDHGVGLSSFRQRLHAAWDAHDSALCIGLDPDPARIPPALGSGRAAILRFCTEIVDATADLVCAFKPQVAYFAAVGAERELETLCAHIRDRHAHCVLILDAKRGDIGDTAEQYAREAFDRYGADAVTVNPYLGTDSIAPFLSRPGRAAMVLCRTSNAGSGEFQRHGAEPLFLRVARTAADTWSAMGEVGLVVGATVPDDLAAVRATAPTLAILVPGVGAQGGDVASAVQAGRDASGRGLIVTTSRAVIYADSGAGFAVAARGTATVIRDAIRAART